MAAWLRHICVASKMTSSLPFALAIGTFEFLYKFFSPPWQCTRRRSALHHFLQENRNLRDFIVNRTILSNQVSQCGLEEWRGKGGQGTLHQIGLELTRWLRRLTRWLSSFGQRKSNQEHVQLNYISIKINSDGAREMRTEVDGISCRMAKCNWKLNIPHDNVLRHETAAHFLHFNFWHWTQIKCW